MTEREQIDELLNILPAGSLFWVGAPDGEHEAIRLGVLATDLAADYASVSPDGFRKLVKHTHEHLDRVAESLLSRNERAER